jgi:hypothetical protein
MKMASCSTTARMSGAPGMPRASFFPLPTMILEG